MLVVRQPFPALTVWRLLYRCSSCRRFEARQAFFENIERLLIFPFHIYDSRYISIFTFFACVIVVLMIPPRSLRLKISSIS